MSAMLLPGAKDGATASWMPFMLSILLEPGIEDIAERFIASTVSMMARPVPAAILFT